jgi:hypothetical protein
MLELPEAQLNVGDVIEFPRASESRILDIGSGRVVLDQGVPGKFRVKAITPESIELEKLPDA